MRGITMPLHAIGAGDEDILERILAAPKLKPRYYIVGPMTGKEQFNFPMFAMAANILRSSDYEAISPAELDVAVGINPLTGPVDADPGFFHECMDRDLRAILTCDGLALLPDWEISSGGYVEITIGWALGKDFIDALTLEPIPLEVIKAHLRLPGWASETAA